MKFYFIFVGLENSKNLLIYSKSGRALFICQLLLYVLGVPKTKTFIPAFVSCPLNHKSHTPDDL